MWSIWNMLPGDATGNSANQDKDALYVGVAMLAALAFGCIVVLFGANEKAAGLLWAGACSSVGWFLGFLFGIPRSLSSDTARTGSVNKLGADKSADVAAAEKQLKNANASGNADAIAAAKTALEAAQKAAADANAAVPQANANNASGAAVAATRGPSTAVNTNLEQISDWLTKIIVGVTLVELSKVLARLDIAANTVAGALGGTPSPVSFAYALMVYFSATGFLGSYLLTRLFLQRAFNDAGGNNAP